MRKFHKRFSIVALSLLLLLCLKTDSVAGADVIKQGIYIDGIDVGGMTREQAQVAVQARVESLKKVQIGLQVADNPPVYTTVGDLGIYWKNPEVLDEALNVGTEGSIITRYKLQKDLERETLSYDIELAFDYNAINNVLVSNCKAFNREAVSAKLTRENGAFVIQEGQKGYQLDIETSIDEIYDALTKNWDRGPCDVALDVDVIIPRGGNGELAEVRDILGSYSTSFKSSGASRTGNVTNGCRLINGITLYPGEEFSTYNTVSPFSEKNGYYMAGSYMNGKVVDSLGGGICQVSTTLYNAVLLAELNVTERHNHSMIVNYVDPSADAAIAESAGKDFRFVNSTDAPIYIEGYVKDKVITFNIYGKETRSSDRKVSYESKVLEVINPPGDVIIADPGQPIGYVSKDSAHIGYKAELWKVVKENGKEISRTQVNSSNYKMVPRTAYVGVATGDPNAYELMMAAIGTGNLGHVQNTIAGILAPPPAE